MISRVFRGKSAYGLIKYLFGEGRRNEHTNAHLVASWDGDPAGLEPALDALTGRHAVGDLVRILEQPVRACDRAPEQHVYHLVLRTAPGDRSLSDEEWAQVCSAAMDRTGIAPTDDPAGCRWVAVRHADDHVHLVATLAREDGRVPRTWGDFAKLAQVRHEFEDRFGLRDTAGRDDGTAAKRVGVKEQIIAERHGRRVPARVALRRKVASAAARSSTFEQFTRALASDGVTVWPRMSDRTAGEVTGYSVSLKDWTNAAGSPVRFGGGKLAPDLSLPKLTARWAGATPDLDVGVNAWSEAERIVRRAAEEIRATEPSRSDDSADTAWAASDLLHGFAHGVEGVHGGALSDAADDFARAGREARRRTPAPSNSGIALRSVARMIAVVTAGNRHPTAQAAALTTSITLLVAAVTDLRRAQSRSHQAEAARVALRHLAVRSVSLGVASSQSPAVLTAWSLSAEFALGPFETSGLRPRKATNEDPPRRSRTRY